MSIGTAQQVWPSNAPEVPAGNPEVAIRDLDRPTDWPPAGPIDLATQDLPHASATTEWWYLNTHLRTQDKRNVSVFAAFFRIARGRNQTTGEIEYAHSLTWAMSDPERGVYAAASRVDEHAAQIGIERIRSGRGSKDPRLDRAMLEVLENGDVPLPDRRFDGAVSVARDRLELEFGDSRLAKSDEGTYELTLRDAEKGIACTLSFWPLKDASRHGDDGLVRAAGGETMFYYFVPRCQVWGTITSADGLQTPASGGGWYDHEFGGHPKTAAADETAPAMGQEMAWTWVAAQLDDGRELTAYTMTRIATGEVVGRRAILVGADGATQSLADFQLTATGSWRSVRTFHSYPTAIHIDIPALDAHFDVDVAFPDQEFLTVISKPAFWEGRCEVHGKVGGHPVQGTAYLERSGYESVETLDDFFTEVGAEVRASVAAVLPLDPTPDEARDLIASDRRPQYMQGVDVSQLARTLFKPIRDISDRGGKSWRSYAALACCDVVQGDSRRFARWLAMPELMHVGSLIVDDVQDRSKVRRGGPACHLIHGEPLAINAGTAAYFLLHQVLVGVPLDTDRRLKIYDLYFEALRAGHAGQALDLGGLADLMPGVVETGDNGALVERVRACHLLKTGAPAGALARMGGVAGGGSDEQIDALGNFFESLGLAFQILDDVLNLRGFKGNLKSRGEDIVNGTVTLPVAKAMGILDGPQRDWLYRTLCSPDKTTLVVFRAVRLLEHCGAIQQCVDEAEQLVEASWAAAAPLFKPSLSKVMLRAFGWYVLNRQY
jgi:geranylgeranyl pyrophosphate synthase/predicted secreted hydrolase